MTENQRSLTKERFSWRLCLAETEHGLKKQGLASLRPTLVLVCNEDATAGRL